MKEIHVETSAGKEHGHVPGNRYHDVDVSITRSHSGRWTVVVLETWGSCQGRDEEHGRKSIIARGRILDDAVKEATGRAEMTGMHRSYLIQAISSAEAAAAAMEELYAESETRGSGTSLSRFPTEELIAELRLRGVTEI